MVGEIAVSSREQEDKAGAGRSDGEGGSFRFADLQPLVERTLHAWAAKQLGEYPPGVTYDAESLLQQVYLMMLDQDKSRFENVEQFRALACVHMRRILVDRARRRRAVKHGGGLARLTLSESLGATEESKDVDLLSIHEALEALEKEDPLAAKLVELRFFGGMSVPRAAEFAGISPRTVNKEWAHARAWLAARLEIETSKRDEIGKDRVEGSP